MRLIALLSWYDERTDWLVELVGSLGRCGIDHIVAVDGAYGLFPGARGSSGSEQASAVLAAAHGAGMGVTVHVPPGPWYGNEIEKRSALFALGHVIAKPDEDWLIVADADEVWEPCHLRELLMDSPEDVAEVVLYERTEHGDSHGPIRKCFRAHPKGIYVIGQHCHYENGYGDVLWGGGAVQAAQLWDVRVRHRPCERTPTRTSGRLTYYERRSEFRVEAVA